jgi:hypothetical protein
MRAQTRASRSTVSPLRSQSGLNTAIAASTSVITTVASVL